MSRATDVTGKLKGPVVPLNVCFTEEGKVDHTSMRRYANWLCEQQTPVLLLTYGSSEYAWLTDDDIRRLTAEMASEINGRALFITSTGIWAPDTCCSFLTFADQAGADAVKVQVNPWMIQPYPDKYIRYMKAVSEASSIPLLLWGASGGNNPVPPEKIAELASWPNVVGMKNDEDQFYYYYDCIRATIDENFAVVSGGQMRNFVFGYQVGSPAYLCTVAPFRPDIALQFYKLLTEKRYDEAWQIVYRYEDPWLKQAVSLDWLSCIKAAIFLHGLFPKTYDPCQIRDDKLIEKVRKGLIEVFGEIRKID
ncbi:MAG: dihydrodipicolinate synthase family protein [Gemmatimonadota bacterium]|nr:dihydrodipicolinate synthase family protein [Gemmatimonadota bacterium]